MANNNLSERDKCLLNEHGSQNVSRVVAPEYLQQALDSLAADPLAMANIRLNEVRKQANVNVGVAIGDITPNAPITNRPCGDMIPPARGGR